MAKQTFVANAILTAAQQNALQNNDFNQTVSAKTASYTLVAADVGTRITMNNASATTITVNTNLFAAGDTLFIGPNLGAGVCTITNGTATVSTSTSLALAQNGGGTLYFTSAGVATFFSGAGSSYGTATGGIGAPTSVTISSVNYQYLTFNSTGTLTVTKAGFFDYLAIGGGGGALKTVAAQGGGGGGAGQVVIGSVYLSANQTVTIGAGSPLFVYDATTGSQGGDTSIAATSPFTQTASGNLSSNYDGAGASGSYIGGGSGSSNSRTSLLVTESIVIGYRGGNSSATTNGGGGGGQSGRGGSGSSTTGGTGGTGFDIAVFVGGSATFKAQGGGGGASVTGGTASTGGVAGSATTTPPNGGANTGQGGGGGFGLFTTGNGGSGQAFIRFTV